MCESAPPLPLLPLPAPLWRALTFSTGPSRTQKAPCVMPPRDQTGAGPEILDGAKLSELTLAGLERRVREEGLGKPHLHVICVGDDPASEVYVGRKKKAAERIGAFSETKLPEHSTLAELKAAVVAKNKDPSVHGIIVQLPLPEKLQPHQREVLGLVSPAKDVDCLHPANVGLLALGEPGLRPATPVGILKLLRQHNVPLQGKHVVVLGKSEIVGRPLALLLAQEDGPAATVTMCDKFTEDVWALTRTADVVVVAAGVHHLLKDPAALRPGCAVVDVGIHRATNSAGKTVLQGDVDADQVRNVCRWITPVPGGVGPMTVACLLEQVVEAAARQQKGPQQQARL